MKKTLNFEKVVLLGRTFKEYTAYFGLPFEYLIGKKILDVCGGVSSFCAEANSKGIYTKSIDPIYDHSSTNIELQCKKDLENLISDLLREQR